MDNHLTKKYNWFITGVAGFIGSHLLEYLLKNNQSVTGIDNFSTGKQFNLDDVQKNVTVKQWNNFQLIHGDICNFDLYVDVTKNIDYCLHQAAIVSVPWSNLHPIETNAINVNGFLNILKLCHINKIKRLVYTSSSAVYGDDTTLPQVENKIGNSLSFYATSKYINEQYAYLYSKTHNVESIGLRYFNVFGSRQNPNGEYSAVIPKWITNLKQNKECYIFGDGKTTRDFCYIDNIIQANILSALTQNKESLSQVYNIANGQETSLNNLYSIIKNEVRNVNGDSKYLDVIYKDFRDGDVRFSKASITKAQHLLSYNPMCTIEYGIKKTVQWYLNSSQY